MRLIDGDALSEWLKDYGQKVIKGERETSLMYVWKHVQDMPTIEPAHGTGYRDGYKRGKKVGYKKGRNAGRKKGKWTIDNSCPFCGFQPWYERDIHTLSYCPNCGADMREEGDRKWKG